MIKQKTKRRTYSVRVDEKLMRQARELKLDINALLERAIEAFVSRRGEQAKN
jgi:post-segregation antitoxin (ccd killing protein)